MRVLLMIAIFLSFPVSSGTLPLKEPDYWNAISGIGHMEFLRRFISSDVCARDIAHREGCLAGLLSLRRILKSYGVEDGVAHQITSPAEPVDFDKVLSQIESLGTQVPRALLYGTAVNAVLLSYDAHARLIPTALMDYQLKASPDLLDTGMRVEISGAGVFVRHVEAGSPAAVAGVKVNDQIVTVDGEDLGVGSKAQSSWWIHKQMDGRPQVYEVDRQGQFLKFKIARMVSRALNVTSQTLSLDGLAVGVVSVHSFNQMSCVDIEKALDNLSVKGVHRFVLDLRGNLGGFLDQGVCVASLFLGNRKIMERIERVPQFPADYALKFTPPKLLPENTKQLKRASYGDEPLVILQNSQSASASEVVAAAVQDYQRGWIVGERSMGKGSTQMITALNDYDGMSIGYTNSENLRVTGVSLQINGVTPDFSEAFTYDYDSSSREFMRELDLFPASFIPSNPQRWQQARPQVAAAVQGCADQNAYKYDQILLQQLGFEDYQLSYSAAVLKCAIH